MKSGRRHILGTGGRGVTAILPASRQEWPEGRGIVCVVDETHNLNPPTAIL